MIGDFGTSAPASTIMTSPTIHTTSAASTSVKNDLIESFTLSTTMTEVNETLTSGFSFTSTTPVTESRLNSSERDKSVTAFTRNTTELLPEMNATELLSSMNSTELLSGMNSTELLSGVNSTELLSGMNDNQTELYAYLDALSLAMLQSLIPTIVYLSLLMGLGLVGNSIVFLVYYRRFKPSATRSYVLTMSVFDLTANVISLPSEIVDIRFFFNFYLPWLCRAVRSVNSFLTLASAFILVAVARDRYRKICHPLDKIRSQRRIRLYISLCSLGAFLLTVPFAVINGWHTIETELGNVTGVACSIDDAFVDTLFPLVYIALMNLAFLVCFGVMVASYTRIGIELWRHKKNLNLGPGSFRGTAAATAGVSQGRNNSSAVEDTSSGPRTDLGSTSAVAAFSVEAVPMADVSLSTAVPASDQESATTAVATFSDKDVLLLSVNNFNYQGPAESQDIDNTDEGFFSGCHGDDAAISSVVQTDGTTMSSGVQDNGTTMSSVVQADGTTMSSGVQVDGTTMSSGVQADGTTMSSGAQGNEGRPTDNNVNTFPRPIGPQNTSSTISPNTEKNGIKAENKDNGLSYANLKSTKANNTEPTAAVAADGNPEITTLNTKVPKPEKEDDKKEEKDKDINETPTRQNDTETKPASNNEKPPSDETLKRQASHRSNSKPPSLLQTVLRPKARQYSMRLGTNVVNAPAPAKRRSVTRRRAVKKIPSSTTFMMVILTAIFVINFLPHLIIIGMRAVLGTLDKGLTGWLLNAYNIGLRSYYMNCAVNSLVYGFCSARFRHECRSLFSRRR